MNRANAIKLRGIFPALLLTSAGGDNSVGWLMPDDRMLPADMVVEVEGKKYIGLVVFVLDSEVTRCGSSDG